LRPGRPSPGRSSTKTVRSTDERTLSATDRSVGRPRICENAACGPTTARACRFCAGAGGAEGGQDHGAAQVDRAPGGQVHDLLVEADDPVAPDAERRGARPGRVQGGEAPAHQQQIQHGGSVAAAFTAQLRAARAVADPEGGPGNAARKSPIRTTGERCGARRHRCHPGGGAVRAISAHRRTIAPEWRHPTARR
jgi:hypothetical protein